MEENNEGSQNKQVSENESKIYVKEEEVERLRQSLPLTTIRGFPNEMIKYQNFWYVTINNMFRNVISIQKHFIARDSDIFITGLPKTGTTWLKSLLFATVNRTNNNNNNNNNNNFNHLLNHHPQELVYNLESDVYNEAFVYPRPHHLHELPSPRLFSTHVPFTTLPESVKTTTSKCRILYICRNPLDMIVSYYYFLLEYAKKMGDELLADQDVVVVPSLEDCFEDFCEGKIMEGPFFEHVLEYWKMSIERPDKVLFLKYEDLKDDTSFQLKRLADFIGMSFSLKEEKEGVIQQIVDLCSIKNMKELDVNKKGVINKYFEKKSYFRKGEVGDWANHFSPSVVERTKKLMQEKLEGTGLSFTWFDM